MICFAQKNAIFNLIKAGLFITSVMLYSCTGVVDYSIADQQPDIYPDYSGITIPPNIAPLNFAVQEEGQKYFVRLYSQNKQGIDITSVSNKIIIPKAGWKKLLEDCKGKDLLIDVFIKKAGMWTKYQTITNHVTSDSIDKFLVYRLFDQGFELWNKMGLYQRCLENFDESPIMINDLSEGNCINCHSFSRNSSKTMMFHMRQKLPGTIIYRNGKLSKINTKTAQKNSPGVYPSWHPGDRYIAFSVNQIFQLFLPTHKQYREAFDALSDIILYDTELNMISECASIASKDRSETYPTWSPDGRYLYFCSAKTLPAAKFNEVKYDLLRISFNPDNHEFGTVIDTIVSSHKTGLSVSFPRISPDGKLILFCMSSYGNFTIWHTDSDLFIKNLETGEISKPAINSNFSESYHSWSSTGRWIVFSSKRSDGFTTELYISYFNKNGEAFKPFILPQRDPDFYKTFTRSYNIPELVTSEMNLNQDDLSKIIKSQPVNAIMDTIK